MATRFFLVRHGHSQAQLDGIVAGHGTCRGPSDRGRRQVETLRARLVETEEMHDATAIYTSVLARAVGTAELLAPVLPAVGPVASDCDLCEIHEPGLDRQAHQPRIDHWRRVGFTTPASAGAESYETFTARVVARLDRLVADHDGETVVVVTHAGVIRAVVASLAQSPLGEGLLLRMRNTSITEVVHDPIDHAPFTWALLRYNDAAHLAAIEDVSPRPGFDVR